MITARILPGKPGVGNAPRQFRAIRQGKHREGLVVEFCAEDSLCWTGNLQPELTKFSVIFTEDVRLEASVLAGGQGYRVNVVTGELLGQFGGDIQSALEVPGTGSVLLCNSTKIEFRCEGGGAIWHSRRISWDGFRDLILLDGELKGAAWMFDDTWHPFTVSLASGVVEGGSYCEAQQEEK